MTLEEAKKYIKCKEGLVKDLKGKTWRSLRSKFKKENGRLPETYEVQSIYKEWLTGSEAEMYRQWNREEKERKEYIKKQVKGNYSFDLVYDPANYHYQTEPSAVYVSGICVIAKNGKYGGFYFSKYIHKREGRFIYACGSHNYPIIAADNKVILKVRNFPKYPLLSDSIQHPEEYNCWRIENIKSK